MVGEWEARFDSKTRISPNGCVHWTGAKAKGYGRFYLNGKVMQAHVVAWERVNGPVPTGFVVDHTCHNADPECAWHGECEHRGCVNPQHLQAKSQGDNLRDAAAGITHCPAGHEYRATARFDARGRRTCRVCHNLRTSKAKKDTKTHCPQGHEYTPENTKITRSGRRFCLPCGRAKAEKMRSSL